VAVVHLSFDGIPEVKTKKMLSSSSGEEIRGMAGVSGDMVINVMLA
jgi:hypothetical protein